MVNFQAIFTPFELTLEISIEDSQQVSQSLSEKKFTKNDAI